MLEVERLLRPAQDRPWPETGGEPRVEDVFILLERELRAVGEDLGAFGGFVECATDDPVLAVVALKGRLSIRQHRAERIHSRPAPGPRY